MLVKSPLKVPTPAFMTEELFSFGDSVERFFEREVIPRVDTWEHEGAIDREIWHKAGASGLLMVSAPEEYGGMGGSFAHEAVLLDVLGRCGADNWGLPIQNVVFAPYVLKYATEAQKREWIPALASGDLIGAISMTEPNAGSDLQQIRMRARLEGDHYVLTGQKMFCTHGNTGNLIMVAAKTDVTEGAKGVSLFFVEVDKVEGFRRGQKLDKIGLKGQDTTGLFFDDVRVPIGNLLGGVEGQGFGQMMECLAQERLLIGVQAMAMIEHALAVTLDYVKQREAFGKRIIDFQNSQFKLAECVTEATAAKVFVNHCIERHLSGTLDAVTAAMVKWWLSDMQCRIVDECLQLHGGYGYINDYPIARMYRDARIQKIYGGTNEIMKVVIGRSL